MQTGNVLSPYQWQSSALPWKCPLTPALVLEEVTLSGRQFAACANRLWEERALAEGRCWKWEMPCREDSLPGVYDTHSLWCSALSPSSTGKMASSRAASLNNSTPTVTQTAKWMQRHLCSSSWPTLNYRIMLSLARRWLAVSFTASLVHICLGKLCRTENKCVSYCLCSPCVFSFPTKLPFIQAHSHHIFCAVLHQQNSHDQLEETALKFPGTHPRHRSAQRARKSLIKFKTSLP